MAGFSINHGWLQIASTWDRAVDAVNTSRRIRIWFTSFAYFRHHERTTFAAQRIFPAASARDFESP